MPSLVRSQIEQGGERVWRLTDFRDQPLTAVAQTLSRLARAGEIQRLSKGIYYRPRQTLFGQSHPNPAQLRQLAGHQHPVFPAGIMAANLLGLTTQAARRGEVSTPAASLPRKLLGGGCGDPYPQTTGVGGPERRGCGSSGMSPPGRLPAAGQQE